LVFLRERGSERANAGKIDKFEKKQNEKTNDASQEEDCSMREERCGRNAYLFGNFEMRINRRVIKHDKRRGLHRTSTCKTIRRERRYEG
jgi:hypothetical protein